VIRIPKVESADDVRWVTARAPGKPIICAIETARGVLAAPAIAAVPGVRFLAMGGVDLQKDLNTSGGNLQTLHARSHLVLASRAAGIEPPIDSVYPHLDDTAGLPLQPQVVVGEAFVLVGACSGLARSSPVRPVCDVLCDSGQGPEDPVE
jgi:citrate lyase subunit beta/citryl-CoA lyase